MFRKIQNSKKEKNQIVIDTKRKGAAVDETCKISQGTELVGPPDRVLLSPRSGRLPYITSAVLAL